MCCGGSGGMWHDSALMLLWCRCRCWEAAGMLAGSPLRRGVHGEQDKSTVLGCSSHPACVVCSLQLEEISVLLIPAAPCTVLSTHRYLMAAGPGACSAMVGLRSHPVPQPRRVLGIRNGDTGLTAVPCPPPRPSSLPASAAGVEGTGCRVGWVPSGCQQQACKGGDVSPVGEI